MRHGSRNAFLAVKTEGGLLPADMLERISAGDNAVSGLDPADYHLPAGEKLNEAVNRSWNRLKTVWQKFGTERAGLSPAEPGTTITRENWLLPMFQELGYGRLFAAKSQIIDDKLYPISHSWHHSPLHLVGCNISLDSRMAGIRGAATASPHSMVQEFLNRSDAHLWGMVSNGLVLRMLRDNKSFTRQAFVEFDLETIFDQDLFSDFVLFWLLCHQSRMEAEDPAECLLEQWSRQAQEQGIRALDRLRNSVEAAISSLGQGFLSHPGNTALKDRLRTGDLDKMEYFRQLLRLIYRLLFLFTAEDRGLLVHPGAGPDAVKRYLDYYSTARLRRLSGKISGSRHGDLYEMLKLVMARLGNDAGCPELALPALGGFLWSEAAAPDLMRASLYNRDLLAAFRELAFTQDHHIRRQVDFKNLGATELGSIYESLLELQPELAVDAPAFTLTTLAGHERKTTGSYYTPTDLINSLLDSALEPVLDVAASADDPQLAILNVKICDPASGSGHILIAAAHRMAKRLAVVRTGDDEPSPQAMREALREIIGRCIYGVDINPMAVELCKVNLWLEALVPGKPLTFLDHHIRCGNSLLGAAPALIKDGIPDAAFTSIQGDDDEFCRTFKRQNRIERAGERGLFDGAGKTWHTTDILGDCYEQIDGVDDQTIKGIHTKQNAYETCLSSDSYTHLKFIADAWCAAFVWHKIRQEELPYPITCEFFRRMESNPGAISDPMRREVNRLADHYRFFHWHIAFPDVFHVPEDGQAPENPLTGWSGGFDVVLGNPPWERVKLQEKEWFAANHPEIAAAPNAAARKRMINRLEKEDPEMYSRFLAALRDSEGISHLLRNSGRYPLCGRGDINTYTVFAETKRSIINGDGRVGCVLPSGIATDDTTKFFFDDLMSSKSLISLYDFENRKAIFPGVHRSYKFCLLTMTGAARPAKTGARFAFFLLDIQDLKKPGKMFTLTNEDIALINPNTKTCPIFRSQKDADLTKTIYRRVPVLINETRKNGNPWNIKFLRMFDMSNDSHLFKTRQELENDGWKLHGNRFEKNGQDPYLPLYEAKMIHHFDHRWATYDDAGNTRDLTLAEKQNPDVVVNPRYWVPWWEVIKRGSKAPRQLIAAYEAEDKESLIDALEQLGIEVEKGDLFEVAKNIIIDGCPKWFLGWRDITNVTNERTVIANLFGLCGVGNNLPLLTFPKHIQLKIPFLVINLTAFAFDFASRFKVGGTHVNFFIMNQLPVFSPDAYEQQYKWICVNHVGDFFLPRAMELIYTAIDLQPFAKDCGYGGPPFKWDEKRRFLIRCELDAAYFHLYGISRDDVEYIMETFPIVKRKDEAQYGEFRTKRVILEIYDAMQQATDTGGTYETPLDPPPGDPMAAHEHISQF
ncbi:MAG: SAM-dependent DNA methyltransferase [Desulfobacteraceae bacterium]|jgi:hypothetical protein|nr:MAG: SAM-dependent DNA methyltransferase [Desulfobacteraceae bacterium]